MADSSYLKSIADKVLHWPLRQGHRDYLDYLNGEELGRSATMRAKCYDCMGGYDQAGDCMVAACPLYPWMPYREHVEEKREVSEKRKIASREAWKKRRAPVYWTP